ncbi:major capsid protein, partial [uncultured marine virus]
MAWEDNAGMTGSATWDNPQLEVDLSTGTADLSGATSATINDMRIAVTMQHLLERDARGGTRYREQVLAHFGVQTDDIRLMRPELLATGSTTVNLSPVATTAAFGVGPVLGELAAFATASAVGRGWTKRFNEHGIVMGLCSIRAELSYQQGMARRFARTSRLDYYWPELSHLGEQVVQSREIYL